MKSKLEQMSSRERVHATIRGLPVDRVPVFFWINAHAGCKLIAEYKHSKHLWWNLLARFLWSRFRKGGYQQAKEIWRFFPLYFDVHSYNYANVFSLELGSDILLASFASPRNYSKYTFKNGHFVIRDMFGVRRGLGSGIYPDMVEPAIKHVTDIRNYRFPDPNDDRLYTIFRKYRKTYPDVSIAAEVWGVQGFTATSLFGMEKFMTSLIDYPEEMKDFFKRCADFYINVAWRSVKAGADMVFIEDDYGYNNRPLISMKMWKEFTYPQLKRQVDAAHEAGALVALHSCGYQMPFLEHYVEIGLDMLQALQPKAGNDFKEAYGKFGDKLTFITGIDIQRGESMTPEALKKEIIDNYRIAGRKGRHILGTTHEVQYTMPDENIRVIFDTVREIQAGVYDNV